MDVIQKFAELRNLHQKALVAYLPGNYPTPKGFKEAVTAIFEGGADILEIGIPFSEPVADGPVIAEAHYSLLERNENITSIMESVKELHLKFPEKALVVMSYGNPILAMGKEGGKAFIDAGVSAIIVPDIPFEEKAVLEELLPKEIKIVSMLAPTTLPIRRKNIIEHTDSFVYCVAVTGVTGERSSFAENEVSFLKEMNDQVKVPFVVGFGISNAEQAKAAAKYADGVVIGTKLTRMAGSPGELNRFINEIKTTL